MRLMALPPIPGILLISVSAQGYFLFLTIGIVLLFSMLAWGQLEDSKWPGHMDASCAGVYVGLHWTTIWEPLFSSCGLVYVSAWASSQHGC